MVTTLIDLPVSLAIQSINSISFAWIMRVISWWGEPEHFIVVMALVGSGLIMAKEYKRFFTIIAATTLSALIGSLLKELISRPRPTADLIRVDTYTVENSFPSNHVLVFTVFFGLLFLFVSKSKLNNISKKILKTIFSLLIILVSFSRIYLGAHWFTDCLASYLLGAMILFFINKYYRTTHQTPRTKHL